LETVWRVVYSLGLILAVWALQGRDWLERPEAADDPYVEFAFM
jgi:hypothetical protein